MIDMYRVNMKNSSFLIAITHIFFISKNHFTLFFTRYFSNKEVSVIEIYREDNVIVTSLFFRINKEKDKVYNICLKSLTRLNGN